MEAGPVEQQNRFLELLYNPESTVKNILASKEFVNYWIKSDERLYSFLISHYDDIIETGLQIKSVSIFSIRCLQVMSSPDPNFRNRLFSETNLFQFTYNYLFNISLYPPCSQKNYFYVLPNIMIDQQHKLHPIFDENFFIELFKHADNDFAYNFILKLIEYAPTSIIKVVKKIEIEKIILSNLIKTEKSIENQNIKSRLSFKRYQKLFQKIITNKLEGNSCLILLNEIDEYVTSAIQNPTIETFSFIMFIDEFSMSKIGLSKWRKIHLKIVPYLSSFCEIVLKSKSTIFTSLSQLCTLISIGITSTTKEVTESFMKLFRRLLSLFFILRENTFLHNSLVKIFNLLLSLQKINSNNLDELDLFNKIIECYEHRENDHSSTFWAQIRLISEGIYKFVNDSKTVNIEKWNEIVVQKNLLTEKIIEKKYGGFVPVNVNAIASAFLESIATPSFLSKNLIISPSNPPKKFSSPLSIK